MMTYHDAHHRLWRHFVILRHGPRERIIACVRIRLNRKITLRVNHGENAPSSAIAVVCTESPGCVCLEEIQGLPDRGIVEPEASGNFPKIGGIPEG
jgi:hypothetical protein